MKFFTNSDFLPEKNEKIALKNVELPDFVYDCYEKIGITTLFRWQFECLTNENVARNRRNLIYTAPTSAGKSLVAEILILKQIFLQKPSKKALYVLPFISVAREKMLNLQKIFRNIGVRVEGYIGTMNAVGGFNSWDLAICTIEKANGLVNHLLETGDLNQISVVVVDELHTVGDPQRGYLLELLLTKMRFYSLKTECDLQVIGMSATLPNINIVAHWLDAELYTTNFRPVPLIERLYCEKNFCNDQLQLSGAFSDDFALSGDSDNVVGLILETVLQNHGVLIFCSTKLWCEQLANTVAKSFEKLTRNPGSFQERLTTLNVGINAKEFFDEYKRCVCCVDPILAKTLRFSVAFHHAGLTMEEREHIERGFRLGVIRVLIATSTLSAGVNLPAKRVIIRSPWGGYSNKPGPCLTVAMYKQMAGRAGRQGIDTFGESILMCKTSELKRGQHLISSPLDCIRSALIRHDKQRNDTSNATFQITTSLKKAVLEIVVSGLATNVEDIVKYLRCTFLFAELTFNVDKTDDIVRDLEGCIEKCVEYLVKNEFVQYSDSDKETITPTQLGSAALTSSLPPDEALFVFADLQNAQRNFVLDTDLHLLYLVIPYNSCRDMGWIDWMLYYDFYLDFNASFKRVANVVGVKESFLASAARSGGVSKMEMSTNENECRQLAVHKRFFAALALYQVISEEPINKVAQHYGCDRGVLQSFQQQASTYAGMMVQFCERLGWYHLKVLLSGFSERIAFGVRRELTELVQIDGIDGSRARTFHSCGFSTISSLIECTDATEIVNVLRKAVPFQSGKDQSTKRPWLVGHSDLTDREAADLILERAKKIFNDKLQRLGVKIDDASMKTEQKFAKNVAHQEIITNQTSLIKLETANDENKSQTENENTKNRLESIDFEDVEKEILNDSWFTDEKLKENFLPNVVENLTTNLSRVSISPSLCKNRSTSLTDSQILDVLNDDDDDDDDRSKNKSTPTLFSDDDDSKVLTNENVIIPKRRRKLLVSTPVLPKKRSKNEEFVVTNLDEFQTSLNSIYLLSLEFEKNAKKIRFCTSENVLYQLNFDNAVLDEKIVKLFRLVVCFPARTIVVEDAKEFQRICREKFNFSEIKARIFCIRTAVWLLNPDFGKLELNSLGKMFSVEFSNLEENCRLCYALYEKVMKNLKENDLCRIFSSETKIVASVAKMESGGINFDFEKCNFLIDKLKNSSNEIEKRCFQSVGRRFSIGSHGEVAKILFVELGLPACDDNSNGNKSRKHYSTCRVTLKKLSSLHELPILIINWRQIQLALNHYLVPFLRYRRENSKVGKIHGVYDRFTATGRIVMREPSLQTFPKNFSVDFPSTYVVNLRTLIVPKPGFLFLAADYSQLELRILAHFSNDEKLLAILNADDGDVFKLIASTCNDVAPSEVTPDQRQRAKQICYGIIYGMGAKNLSVELGVSEEAAVQFMDSFRAHYQGIHIWIANTLDSCRKRGYVETISGRRRYLEAIRNGSKSDKAQAERQAVNTTIQGSAADIFKAALIRVDEQFRLAFSVDGSDYENFARIVLQMHDELILEVRRDFVERARSIMKSEMECNYFNLNVKLPVKFKLGGSWGEMNDFSQIVHT